MPLPRLFRLSFFLSLGVSTLTLAYASQVQNPELDIYYFMIGLLIVLAGLTEDRWRMSNLVANLLGVVIAVACAGWYFTRQAATGDEPGDFLLQLLPWAGVLLGVLLLAKLFRPKNMMDYWIIHAIALVQVVLASVLAMYNKLDRDAPYFPVLLLGYLLSVVWSLRNLSLYNDAVLLRRSTGVTITELHKRAPRATLGLLPSLGWYSLIMVFGLVIFFAIPRARSPLQSLFGSGTSAQTGYNSNLDLNAQGEVEVTDELIFEVQATNWNGQAVALPEGQRWRGDTCARYQEGRWQRGRSSDSTIFDRNRIGTQQESWFRLSYSVDVSRVPESESTALSGTRFPNEVPLFSLDPYPYMESAVINQYNPRLALADNDLEPTDIDFRRSMQEGLTRVSGLKRRTKKLMYFQDVPTIRETHSWTQIVPYHPVDLWRKTRDGSPALRYYPQLLELPENIVVRDPKERNQTPTIPEKTQAILDKLVEQKKLDPIHITRLKAYNQGRTQALQRIDEEFRQQLETGSILPERQAETLRQLHYQHLRLTGQQEQELAQARQQVAEALESYLATSGEYKYSLSRSRLDTGIDPTRDFLCNVKEGHCARFASALALMLRSLGIPCRIVIGFRGSVWNEASKMHEVRGFHAHAWVEALLSEQNLTSLTTDGTRFRARLGWRALDPTPISDATGSRRSYLANNFSFVRSLWEFFILDFAGPEQRRKFRELFTNLGGDQLVAWWKQLSWGDVIWISGTLVATVTFLLTFGRKLWRYLLAQLAKSQGRQLDGSIYVPFFAQLMRLLRRYNLRREPAQTPAEFIEALTTRLQAAPATALVSHVPREVVESYYAVRFGQTPLEPSLTDKMKQKIDALEEALRTTK
jgi:hypothetical protein